MFPGRPVGAGGKTGIAPPAPSAHGDHDFLTGFVDIRQQIAGFRVVDQCSGRDLDRQVSAPSSVTVLASAVAAVFRHESAVENKTGEALFAGFRHKDDVAAGRAIAPVRTAFGHERFPPETAAAIAAVTGFDRDFRLIYKHDLKLSVSW